MDQQRAGDTLIRDCPICGEKYGLDSQDRPFHYACSLDGDHDVCDPDDGHIPHG